MTAPDPAEAERAAVVAWLRASTERESSEERRRRMIWECLLRFGTVIMEGKPPKAIAPHLEIRRDGR